MSRTEVRVVVLVEDDAQERFMRRLVDRLHLKPVRYQKCIDCNGVLARLGPEVEIIRKKKNQKNLALIAVAKSARTARTGDRRTDLAAPFTT